MSFEFKNAKTYGKKQFSKKHRFQYESLLKSCIQQLALYIFYKPYVSDYLYRI